MKFLSLLLLLLSILSMILSTPVYAAKFSPVAFDVSNSNSCVAVASCSVILTMVHADLIVVWVVDDNNPANPSTDQEKIADSLGSTWTFRGSGPAYPGTSCCVASEWISQPGRSGVDTITASFSSAPSGGRFPIIVMGIYSNGATVQIDSANSQVVTASGSNGQASWTANASPFAMVVGVAVNQNSGSASAGSGYTQAGLIASYSFFAEYISTPTPGTPTTQNPTISYTINPTNWNGFADSFAGLTISLCATGTNGAIIGAEAMIIVLAIVSIGIVNGMLNGHIPEQEGKIVLRMIVVIAVAILIVAIVVTTAPAGGPC